MVELPSIDPGSDVETPDVDEGLRALAQAHGAALRRFLTRWTLGEPQATEELVRETLVRAWKNIDHLDVDPAVVRPWLFTVARRVAIERGRAQPAVDEPAIASPDAEPARPAPDAEAVRRALGGLSPEHRDALVEVYFRGRPVGDAARALGISEAAVRSRTYDALRALRAALRPEA